MKVLAAMSGGVDSSVAAALMVEAGHEVVGATMKMWEGPNGEAPTAGCCTVSDAEDARRVAAGLGIPYYVFDYTEEFKAGVVDRFIDEYVSGRTPNPCVECNRSVKFDHFMTRASELGCDLVITGHYARTTMSNGAWSLHRGADPSKDQSYVLSMLGQPELNRVRFPVGELTKSETRAKAAILGLRNADKPDSQDICFVGKGNYRRFLKGKTSPGVFVDVDGNALGHHSGVANFTIGQRRGLGLSASEPRYVVDLDAASGTVVIGKKSDLLVKGVVVDAISWVAGFPTQRVDIEIQIRYRSAAVSAQLLARPDGLLEALFVEPQSAPAPGQAAVFYYGDEVLGGGTIRSVLR